MKRIYFLFSPLMRSIASLPTELHDLIKSFLPLSDQIKFFHCRRRKFGSSLIEGKVQVKGAFFKAVVANKADVVEHLLKCYHSLDPSYDDNWAIQSASQNGHVEVVKMLLADERVDPSADDNGAIRWASEEGHVAIVKILLADGRVNPNCAEVSIENGVGEVDRVILADARVDKFNFFIKAVRGGNLDLVKYIILSDPTIDISYHLAEAIDIASNRGCTELVDYLRKGTQSVGIGE